MADDAPDAGDGLMRRLRVLWGGALWALALKELRQIRRDRRLVLSLVVPPTLQVLLFGLVLDPQVRDLRLGVVDQSRTAESRELVSVFAESRSFRVSGDYQTADDLDRALRQGRLDAGIVIPWDYARRQARGGQPSVQLLVDAVNANTAQLAQGYAEGALAWLNQYGTGRPLARLPTRDPTTATDATDPPAAQPPGTRGALTLRTALLYNPGLVTAWFIVTGTMGTLIILNGSLVSAATMVREKETGTVEQLLMTPTSALEIVAAKMVPVFVLLMGMVVLVLTLARLVFGVPFRGSTALVVTASALCVLTGISIGTLISTFARSATQAQLMSFFVNPPLAVLSGALTPIEAMPRWIQPLTLLNPIRHFAEIARGILVKGVGLEVVYPQLLALAAFTAVLVGISVWRFRRQLG
jgi:ABC-2 type transport system permease protein